MALALELQGSIKTYEWGKKGMTSVVARLHKENSEARSFVIDEQTPYAELWMGTHKSGPSTIISMNEMKLSDWLLNHPESLGKNISKRFGKKSGLPFLFKVLSVNKPLSIQAHPDLKNAKKLHKEFPDRYPDANHKPELAIALTPFEALCGFRPLAEIKKFFKDVPQLREVVGSDIANKFLFAPGKKELKRLFTAVMTCQKEDYLPYLEQITQAFKQYRLVGDLYAPLRDIFLKTVEQYPGDVGCFCLFFLNYIKIDLGEAIFLAANEPHAYLSGDCLECMACSDNVIRAGLTPKFRDVDTLCSLLSYECKPAGQNIYLPGPDEEDCYLRVYKPPVSEFAVVSLNLRECGDGLYNLKVIQSASILFIYSGSGAYIVVDGVEEKEYPMREGSIIFISSGAQLYLKWFTDIHMFRAFCPH